jgi:hypothetical protein
MTHEVYRPRFGCVTKCLRFACPFTLRRRLAHSDSLCATSRCFDPPHTWACGKHLACAELLMRAGFLHNIRRMIHFWWGLGLNGFAKRSFNLIYTYSDVLNPSFYLTTPEQVLYCSMLWCTVLCCAVLCCAVLYYTVTWSRFLSSSSSIVLTRLSGLRSRPTTSQKLW